MWGEERWRERRGLRSEENEREAEGGDGLDSGLKLLIS
jgi:hypothetical protein